MGNVSEIAVRFWEFVKTLNLRRDQLGRETFDLYAKMETNPIIRKHITRRYPSS